MENKYVHVIIDISHEKVDRPFCYKVPENLQDKIEIGSSVLLPFGKGNTLRRGYVIQFLKEPDFELHRIKEIVEVREGIHVENKMIRLASWMKEEYGCTMIQALQTVLPVKAKVKHKEDKVLLSLVEKKQIQEALNLAEKKKQKAKVRVLKELLNHKAIPYTLLVQKLHISSSTVQSLVKAGLVQVVSDITYRNPIKNIAAQKEETQPPLSLEQRKIISKIEEDRKKNPTGKYLIHGITGSGKTRVYIELIEQVLLQKKAVIMLIPEIALTFQTVMRFQKRFGNRVSVLNSSLSAGEKFDQCERARKGEIDIIIGPRSALFTPFETIGMILIDEEHESSYKSEAMPKYHAREVAEEIARLHNASLVLGSATPSLESYEKAKRGEYQLFELTKRLTGGTLPTVYIEDLRLELRKGNRSIFSEKLQELIWDRLKKKEQIMLFLNRRGYSGFLSCRSCGEVIKCPHCDVSLTLHKTGKMVCHYCGYEKERVFNCPKCSSKYISGFKAGTQKIEEEFSRIFGEAKILRMDKDTTGKKDSYDRILSEFMEEKAQVLIGTQMIVKGHDFPKVTLVGILAADISLGVNDFRASERTFQLLTQAAGRAGRGELPGEVVIQSYQPEHYSIRTAAKQEYKQFYEEEILYRKLGHYPPLYAMLVVQIFGRKKEEVDFLAKKLAEISKQEGLMMIGPTEAAIGKVNDIYRMRLILKHKEKKILIEKKNEMEEKIRDCEKKEIIVQFDFNPMSSF